MATSIRNGGRRSRLQGSNSRGCSLVHLLLAVVTWVFLLLCWKHLRPNSSLQIRGDYEALLAEADALVAMYHNKSVVNGDTSRGVGGQGGWVDGQRDPLSDAQPVPMIRGTTVLRDVVLGMAMNTDPKNFAVFSATLREVSTADAVIFVNMPIDPRLAEISTKFRITTVGFRMEDMGATVEKYHPSTIRWSLMKRYLDGAKNKYGRVWMIDVRDSMFQQDPFKMLPPYKPEVSKPVFLTFKGVESMKIVECGWNGGWVRDCFGTSILDRIGNNYIICSGVSAGTIDAVMPYLDKMAAITMGEQRSDLPKHKFPQCERNGVDQGTHNVLVHSKLIRGLKVLSQGDGPVANMQARIAKVQPGGQVVNAKGSVYAVVHQYDRNPTLQKMLFKKHVYWTDTSDPMVEWAETMECRGFKYEKDVDLFKGRCDLAAKGGATGPASCCKMCKSAGTCEAFTYTEAGMCFLKTCGLHGSAGGRGSSLGGAISAYRID